MAISHSPISQKTGRSETDAIAKAANIMATRDSFDIFILLPKVLNLFARFHFNVSKILVLHQINKTMIDY